MGVRLMRNFRRPYFAASIPDFWRRWHISLSTWFRDYLYIPLGGNRVSKARWYRNIALTFVVSGLWHGASWTFVVWGALHAAYMVLTEATRPIRATLAALVRLDRHPRASAVVSTAFTFFLTLTAWTFFRARTIADALYAVGHMYQGFAALLDPRKAAQALAGLGLGSWDFSVAVLAIGVLLAVDAYREWCGSIVRRVRRLSPALRWAFYQMALFAVLLLGYSSARPEFIYFQF